MSALRCGVLGLGEMGRHHARVLQHLDGVELVAVADVGGDVHRAVRGIPVEPDLEALLTHGLDMCVVAVPTADHEAVGLELAARRIHTLIEKPLAGDSGAARRLLAAFAGSDVLACVGHIERYNPALQSLRDRLAAGELGALFQVATRRQGPFPPRVGDVGVVKDLATHDIDLTAWIAGQPFQLIAAQVAHKTGRAHEDLVAATGRLRDGTVTNHLVNWLTPVKERVTAVTGERGTFVADTLSADLTFHTNGDVPTSWEALQNFQGVSQGDTITYAIPKPEPLAVELAAFRDAVLGKDARVVTLEEGLATLIVAEACLESATTRRTVEVAEG